MSTYLVYLLGCWLLVVGCWLLVVGCWLLVVGYDVGDGRGDDGGRTDGQVLE